MPITTDHVGRSYPASAPCLVSADRIAEFATALGMTPGPTAPPTFAAVIAAQAWQALFSDPELGLELSRTVHTDQRFEFFRPIRAGDEVVGVLTIDRVRTRGAVDLLTISVEVTDTAGEPICRAVSSMMHTRREQA